MIAIIDYGVGNLFSLTSSLDFLGIENKITADENEIKNASHIILPGVGAFGDAIKKLTATGLDLVVKNAVATGKPLLGICLGMQLLFDKSFEYGENKGLGLVKGEVSPLIEDLTDKELKVPHIGWNSLEILKDDPIFKYIKSREYVYYVHSFYAKKCDESLLAVSDYSAKVAGVVKNKNVYGMQFHPEKSGETGLNLLKAFGELEARS
ncbi:MAG: imidazole glycerol phosphate synthase subunit HisH [Oscillospiraceae bacterium]